jgi:hypothetical protein
LSSTLRIPGCGSTGYRAGGGFAGSTKRWRRVGSGLEPCGGALPAAAGAVQQSMNKRSRRDPEFIGELIFGLFEASGCLFELAGCLPVVIGVVGAAVWFCLRH